MSLIYSVGCTLLLTWQSLKGSRNKQYWFHQFQQNIGVARPDSAINADLLKREHGNFEADEQDGTESITSLNVGLHNRKVFSDTTNHSDLIVQCTHRSE
jgi:hypothetical protein